MNGPSTTGSLQDVGAGDAMRNEKRKPGPADIKVPKQRRRADAPLCNQSESCELRAFLFLLDSFGFEFGFGLPFVSRPEP
jgi:hypothetical protein